jgi:hypothetical protein
MKKKLLLALLASALMTNTAYAYEAGPHLSKFPTMTAKEFVSTFGDYGPGIENSSKEELTEIITRFEGMGYKWDDAYGLTKAKNADGYEIMENVSEVFRGCSMSEVGGIPYIIKDNGDHMYFLTLRDLSTLANRQAYIDEWVEKTLPTIVPEGTSKADAIRKVYQYTIDAIDYDTQATPADPYLFSFYQGVYGTLSSDGKGICASYAKMMRVLTEALPITADGVVDYTNGATGTVTVSLLVNRAKTHQFCGIIGDDGKLYGYDPCSGDTQNNPDAWYGFDAYAMTDHSHALASEFTL